MLVKLAEGLVKAGALAVTAAFDTGSRYWSSTTTINGAAKGAFAGALSLSPERPVRLA
jgi:hypothetical protein